MCGGGTHRPNAVRCYQKTMSEGLPPGAILPLLQTLKRMIFFLFSLKSFDIWSFLTAHLLHIFLYFFILCSLNGLTAHIVQYKKYKSRHKYGMCICAGLQVVNVLLPIRIQIRLSISICRSGSNFGLRSYPKNRPS